MSRAESLNYSADPHRHITTRSLGKQISFLARSIQRIVHNELAPLGVGSGTHFFLRLIHQKPGITQNELSVSTQVDKATVTKGLAKLESRGYMRRESDRHDHRIRRLYLTENGSKTLPAINATLRKVTKICGGRLSQQEVSELFRLLDLVENAVSDYFSYDIGAGESG